MRRGGRPRWGKGRRPLPPCPAEAHLAEGHLAEGQTAEAPEGRAIDAVRSDRYLTSLLWLLVTAAFFEGYDASILALLLPNIQATFHVSEAALGLARVPVELGLFVAFFVASLADRWGRRPVLLVSVAGYTAFTALTAFSWDLWSFAFLQFGARVFLGAEFATGITMVAEEFPAHRRGRALGTLLTFEALGTIAVGFLLGAGLQRTALGWRSFFLVGLVPLAVVGAGRSRLRETLRFTAERRRQGRPRAMSLLAAWKAEYRKNLVVLGMIHLLRSVPLFAATAWWAYFAERERGFSEGQVALYIIAAYGVGCLGYLLCGWLMERIGRRPTAMLYLTGAITFAVLMFQVRHPVLSFLTLVLAVAFGPGMEPVLSALGTELFPTAVRSQAAAWLRNWFEIAGFVLGPALVGVLGDHVSGAIGNIGDSVSLLMLLALPALWLVWRHVPETAGRELEEIAAHEAMTAGGGGE